MKRCVLMMWLALLGMSTQWVLAQSYPTRPIRLIVPMAAGGGTDITARVLAQKLAESFRQSIIVDNRAGAGGLVGIGTMVRSAPDGYTLGVVSGSFATNAATYKLNYDPVNDITVICLIGESGYLVTLPPSMPIKNVKELIAHAKANPGKLSYGSSGHGGSTHLATALFELMAGVKMTQVPYKSAGAMLTALIGGEIQLVFGATMPATLPQLKAGRVRSIAITTLKRTGILWAAHYASLDARAFSFRSSGKRPATSDPAVPRGDRYILLFGAGDANVFGNPTPTALHAELPAEMRKMLAMRIGERVNIMTEAARVDGPEAKSYQDGMALAPCIQFGSFQCTYEGEEEALAYYAQWRMPAMTIMPGCVRTRKLASVAGWAKHAILYEFLSLEARNHFLETHEDGDANRAWTDKVFRSFTRAPGSSNVARRIWPPVA